MNSSKTKVFSEIDLGEFERRLLAAHHVQRGTEDPLSELTRLVSTIAADRAAGAKIVALASPSPKPERPAPAPAPESNPEPTSAAEPALPKLEPKFAPESGPIFAARREPTFALKPEPALEPEPPLALPPEPELSFEPEPAPETKLEAAPVRAPKAAAAISPRLEKLRARVAGFGTDSQHDPELVPEPREPPTPLAPPLQSAIVESEPDNETPGEFVAPPPVVEYSRVDRGARGKSWYLKVGGLTALGVVMAAGAISMKLGVTGSSRPPPLILAAESPTKVAPPSETGVQSPGDSGSLLLNDSATRAPAKIVTHEEVPVDLSAIVRESQPAPAPAPQPSASATANVAEATPVAPTADTPVVAPTESLGAAPQAPPAAFPAAKHVKTVSVRPDGTLISVDAAAAPSPSAAPAPAAPAPENVVSTTAPMAATPTLVLPEKSTSKSSARVTASKTATTVPPDNEFNPPNFDQATAPERPAKLPTKLRPPKTAAESAPVVASNATPAAEGAGGGGWAVQLAAPRSEAEAQADVSRLKSKYADNLGDAPLAIHKAEVNGETIFRVRAGGLTKADAAALCAKLKASGGDCFVARN